MRSGFLKHKHPDWDWKADISKEEICWARRLHFPPQIPRMQSQTEHPSWSATSSILSLDNKKPSPAAKHTCRIASGMPVHLAKDGSTRQQRHDFLWNLAQPFIALFRINWNHIVYSLASRISSFFFPALLFLTNGPRRTKSVRFFFLQLE